MRDFFEAPGEQEQFVFVSREVAAKALRLVTGCESCRGDDAEIPFAWVLDRLTGLDPSVADYVLETPLACRFCGEEISDKTLVDAEFFEGRGSGSSPHR